MYTLSTIIFLKNILHHIISETLPFVKKKYNNSVIIYYTYYNTFFCSILNVYIKCIHLALKF